MKRKQSKNAAHGWHADGVNDKCERLEPCGVMNDQSMQLQTACRCGQVCTFCASTCVASFT